MSSKLKPIDLTGASVGSIGTIDFNQFSKFAPNDPSKKAHIRILNESGCGLDVVFLASGNSHSLPAGAWGTFDVEPNDGSVQVTVTYTLPNPPVSQVFAMYYAPGENVPAGFTLGNSPIGVGGVIAVTNVSSLSNETNAANTLVIDMGITGNTLLVQMFNDGHFTWNVLQSGVVHQILKGQTSGNPLLLGQVGDNVEVLGGMFVDGAFSVTGNSSLGTVTGTTIQGTTFDSNAYHDGAGNDGMVISAGSTTRIQSAGTVALQSPAGSTQLSANSTDVVSSVQLSAPKFILTGTVGNVQLYTNGISRISAGTYAGSGSGQLVNHGLGAVPNIVVLCPKNGASTTSVDADTYTSTQFTAATFSAMTIAFLAIRF